MTRSSIIGMTMLAAAVVLCASAAAPRTPAQSKLPPCFAPDSGTLQFGSVKIDLATGDASGMMLVFDVKREGLTGGVFDARGDNTPPRPLEDLRFDPATDSLSFWYASDTETKYLYSLKVSCDSLWGTGRLSVTATSPGTLTRQMFPRFRRRVRR